MAAANNPTALLDLDLNSCPDTGEPMFFKLQVLDEQAQQLRDDEVSDLKGEHGDSPESTSEARATAVA